MLADALEMLHHGNIALRKAQVYADLARANLAAEGQGHRGDDLRSILPTRSNTFSGLSIASKAI